MSCCSSSSSRGGSSSSSNRIGTVIPLSSKKRSDDLDIPHQETRYVYRRELPGGWSQIKGPGSLLEELDGAVLQPMIFFGGRLERARLKKTKIERKRVGNVQLYDGTKEKCGNSTNLVNKHHCDLNWDNDHD